MNGNKPYGSLALTILILEQVIIQDGPGLIVQVNLESLKIEDSNQTHIILETFKMLGTIKMVIKIGFNS